MKTGRPSAADRDLDLVMVARIVETKTAPRGATRAEAMAAAESLVLVHGMSFGEVSRILGCSRRTIERLSRRSGWVTDWVPPYDTSEVHQKIAAYLAEYPRATLEMLGLHLGTTERGMSRKSVIKYTRSAAAAGVIPESLVRRNRIKPPAMSTCVNPEDYR